MSRRIKGLTDVFLRGKKQSKTNTFWDTPKLAAYDVTVAENDAVFVNGLSPLPFQLMHLSL
jgi:hypothetical protein